MRLKGKFALVTGASGGIGRAIAIELARQGADVAINDLNIGADAKETAAAIEAHGRRALLCQANVSKDGEVREMFRQILDAFGRIDILVNNVGITRFIPYDDLDGVLEEDWDDLFAVNVKGSFFCAREAARSMKEHGGGDIVNISSLAGTTTIGSSIPYAVSKIGVIQLTRCLAVTLAPSIKVNCVAPGPVKDTRWNEGRGDPEEIAKANARNLPLQRVNTPQDIADSVLYLILSATSTGVVLPVDCGKSVL